MELWCATTAPGLEAIAREDLADHGAEPTSIGYQPSGLVGFEVPSYADGVDLVHRVRTIDRLGPVLADAELDPEDPWDQLEALADEIDWTRWIDKRTRWGVRVARAGEHPYGSPDVERRLGGFVDDRLTEALDRRPPVDLDDPDTQIRGHLDGEGHLVLWIDLVGHRSLHRRGVRAVDHPAAMKDTLAAALVDRVGWDPSTALADPMGGGGTLVVEAAWAALGVSPVHLRAGDLLFHRVPRGRGQAADPGPGVPPETESPADPWFVLGDHSPERVEGAQANLERAGVRDLVDTYVGAARSLPEHVDEVGAVVANPPYGIRSGEGQLDDAYEGLVDGALEVLAPGGRIGLLTPKTDIVRSVADGRGLTVAERTSVYHGRLVVDLIVLET